MSGSGRLWGDGEHLPAGHPTVQELQTQTGQSFPRKLQIFDRDILDFLVQFALNTINLNKSLVFWLRASCLWNFLQEWFSTFPGVMGLLKLQ